MSPKKHRKSQEKSKNRISRSDGCKYWPQGACLDEVDPPPFSREVCEAKQLVDQAAKRKPDQDGMTKTVWWQQSEKSRADE